MQPGLELRVLGGFVARLDGEPIARSAWTRPTAARLVRCLISHGDHPVEGDELCEQLWPQLTPVGARRSIHVAVHYARRVLGDARVEHDDGRYRLALASDDVVDVWNFQEAAENALHRKSLSPARSALAMWTGEPFVEDGEAAWARACRGRLEALRTQLEARLTS